MSVVFHPGTFRARFAAKGTFENNQGRGYVTYRTHAAEGAKHAGCGICTRICWARTAAAGAFG